MMRMNEKADLHVVFGASGGAGGAIVRELRSRGQRVRAVTRSGGSDLPTGVEAVRADAANRAETRRACEGATVVYHAVNVPYPAWAETLPPVMDGLIDAAGAAGATLVYADNLYAYGPVERPMTEETPAAATTRKGQLRARLAETLLAAHRAGTVRAVIGRGSDYYGPGGASVRRGRATLPRGAERRQGDVGRESGSAALADLHRRLRAGPGHAGRARGGARSGLACAAG
jgi:nucleoside-diphosphate-sugar epimerase